MSFLGFDALGRLALGQLPRTVTPSSLVFSSFSIPLPSKYQRAVDKSFVVLPVAVAATPTPVFTAFSQPLIKPPFFVNLDQDLDCFLVPLVITEAADFQDWDFPPKAKAPQEGFITQTNALGPAQTPPWFVFSDFGRAPQSKLVQTDIQPTALPIVVTVVQPSFTGFSDFGIPSQRRLIQPDISGTLQPQIVAVFQPYVFSPFEQPQFKKQPSDQHTRFNYPPVYQPYVFSVFSQPSNVRSKYADTPTFTFFIPNIVSIPNFSGFSDFGPTTQLIGTQRRQDGASVDFRILQPTFIASPLVFFGFYDFGINPKSTAFNSYKQPQVTNLIAIPPPIPLEDAFGGKRWKYQETKKGHEHEKKKPKVIPLDSSNLVDMAYDEEARNLKIQFKTYKYENVSPRKAKALQNAESHGKYFHKHIKDQHPATLIKTRTK